MEQVFDKSTNFQEAVYIVVMVGRGGWCDLWSSKETRVEYYSIGAQNYK